MEINISNITTRGVELDTKLEFNEEYTKNTEILEVKNAYVTGKVFEDVADGIVVSAVVSGTLVLKDTISLQPIDYPFLIEIDEIIEENSEYLKKEQNILDIMGVLWQNIVLEVPIRYTKEENVSLKGEGWALNSTEDKIDPRLSELKTILDNEEGVDTNGSSI